MPMPISLNQLGNVLARWASAPVECPDCSTVMPFKVYHTRHVKSRHGVVNATTCPFCRRYTWPRDKKARPEHVWHRLECAKKFLNRQRYDGIPIGPKERPCQICLGFDSDLYRRRLDDKGLVPSFGLSYESVLENEHFFRPYLECTRESGLGYEASAALTNFDKYDWYHVLLPAIETNSFVDAFRRAYLNEYLAALPFWCLCGDDRRHVLLACLKTFSFDWNGAIPIASPFELATLIDAVSRPNGGCEARHYYINRPLYPHALLAMYSMIPGGIEKWLTDVCRKRNVWSWHDRVMLGSRGWSVPIKDANVTNVSHCPIPTCMEPTPGRVSKCYVPGLKLWFAETRFPPGKDWLERQLESGNALLEAVGEEAYVLSPEQQIDMNRVMKLKREWNEELLHVLSQYESERDRYRTKYEALLLENVAIEKCLIELVEEKKK